MSAGGNCRSGGEWEDELASGFNWGDEEDKREHRVWWECRVLSADCVDTGAFYSRLG